MTWYHQKYSDCGKSKYQIREEAAGEIKGKKLLERMVNKK
jgi:hypothetical protein